jgi:hypothetical protein
MAEYDHKNAGFFRTPVGIVVVALILFVGSVIASAIGTVGAGALQRDESLGRFTQVVLGYLFYVPAVIMLMLAALGLIVGGIRWAMFGPNTTDLKNQAIGDPQQQQLLRVIAERLLISETAKRITYRKQDREALRQAIREDIDKGDFDTAMVLVEEMATTYGYREESEVFREEITKARQADREAKIDAAIASLNAIIARHDWDAASAQASKIQRLFPDSTKTRNLTRMVQQAREQHKQNLEREFLSAAARDDVDRAVELLKELDRHLTAEEAEPFRETARGVIGKKRDNLGVQFKLAVHDKEWTTAVRVGEQIIREFPNTKMAEEVRGRLDLLRERAAGQQAARERELA